jgi:nucleobindin
MKVKFFPSTKLSHSILRKEEFHSTPETQTEESYSHPEDIEHFSNHEAIEWEEAHREARFQGISLEDLLAQREVLPPPPPPPGQPENAMDDQIVNELPQDNQQPLESIAPASTGPKFTRPQAEKDPKIKYSKAAQEKASQPEWGTGETGYRAPRSPSEKLRKNLPYKVRTALSLQSRLTNQVNLNKYKFKRNWGDF